MKCGCHDTVHIQVDDEDKEYGTYAFLTYMNGNWYRDQNDKVFRCIGRKLKKIWRIIMNKDFHYSEICMNKEDLQAFKEYLNQF